jgi:hypothetical protein
LLSTFDICIHFDFNLLAFLHPTRTQLLRHARVLHRYPTSSATSTIINCFGKCLIFWLQQEEKKTPNFLNNSNFQVKVLNLYNIQPMNLISWTNTTSFYSIHNAPFAFCLQYFMNFIRKTGLP